MHIIDFYIYVCLLEYFHCNCLVISFQGLSFHSLFHIRSHRKIQDFPPNFLAKKLSANRQTVCFRLISEKMEALYSEFNQKMEAATNSYSPTGNFLQYVYSVLVTKNHQKIWSSCLGHEFSFTFFLMTLIMATEQLYWRKILGGSSCFICLWLPISIMKRCAEPCALQFYHISVNVG